MQDRRDTVSADTGVVPQHTPLTCRTNPPLPPQLPVSLSLAESETDIILLQETWSTSITHCPMKYRELVIPSLKHPAVKKGRDSGGIIIWFITVYEFLADFITPQKGNKSHIWIKIQKEILNTKNDIYVIQTLFDSFLDTTYRHSMEGIKLAVNNML